MPSVTYRNSDGSTATVDVNQLQNLDPQLYSQYLEKVGQPSAQVQQTQTSTAATGAEIPGIQAESGIKQVQAQQVSSPLNLKKDLTSGMTLKGALSKYTALGMSADDVFKNYLAQSPHGLPNESPTELQNLGIKPETLGQIGQNGSFADRWNTKQAIMGLRDLSSKWNTVSNVSKLGAFGISIPTASSQGYDTQRQVIGQHLSSLIPGAPGGQGPAADLINKIPDVGHVTELEPGAAQERFNGAEKGLLNVKGYSYKDLGLTPKDSPSGADGKTLLNNLLQTAIPAGGAIAGGVIGGGLGALIPGADMTGVPEVAGAVAGSGAGGAGGQALADILTGEKPGSDVATTGILSGAGEGVGAALGGILSKAGGALASKVSDGVFNKVVSASPDYVTDIGALKNTATKYGLMDGNVSEGLTKMPQVMSDIGDKIQTALSQVKKPVDLKSVSDNILNDFSKKTNAFENTQDFKDAQEYIKSRLYSATGNDNPISSFLSASGKPLEKEGANTTYSALYNLKSEVAKDLKPVFKAQANPNISTNFTPKQEANLALWNGLKNEIDKADPAIRQLNNDQHNMFDIAKGFVKEANGAKGGGGPMGNIFDVLAGNMAGGLPGALAVHAIRKGISSEGGRELLSNILQSGAVKQTARSAGAGLGSLFGTGQ